MCLRPLLFCDVTYRMLIVVCRRFGTAYRSHRQRPKSPSLLHSKDETGVLCRNLWKTTNIRCVTTKKSKGLSYVLKYRVIMVIFFRNFKPNFNDILVNVHISHNVTWCWNIKVGKYYFARWDLQSPPLQKRKQMNGDLWTCKLSSV